VVDVSLVTYRTYDEYFSFIGDPTPSKVAVRVTTVSAEMEPNAVDQTLLMLIKTESESAMKRNHQSPEQVFALLRLQATIWVIIDSFEATEISSAFVRDSFWA
jgi:hypothetical protein